MITELIMFPGVLFHELAHYLACLLTGVKVTRFNVSLRYQSGFVEHTVPKSIIKSIFIAIAPGLLALMTAFLLIQHYFTSDYLEIGKYLIIFIILYNSFPSKEDTKFYQHHHIVKKVLTFPLFLVFRIFHYFNKSELLKISYCLMVIGAALKWF